MAARCLNRPPGPGVGNPNTQAHSGTGGPSSSQPGPQPAGAVPPATGLDAHPGAPLSSHPQIPPQSRPFFYIQHMPPPPLPPFLHYQWPMPLPYNPFAGFPAMGYGMVMPPFPPTPYMEAPGYVFPHMQPVDYRRFLPTPQFPAASAAFQGQVPNRRFRPQQNVPVPRETMSSEVQTEPTRMGVAPGYAREGSPTTGSESGRGTTSVSPSPEGSSAERRVGADVELDTLPGSDAKESSPTKCTMPSEVQKRSLDNGGQRNASCGRGSFGRVCENWSVCSTDCIVPVCSSSDREDDTVAKERRVSFPDILMNWSVGTPPVATLQMGDERLLQRDGLPLSKETATQHEKTLNQSLTGKGIGQLADPGKEADKADVEVFSPKASETLHKILKLPFILNESLHASRNVNESVWSVDSLVPYVPSRDWMVRNGLVDSLSTVPDDEPEQANDSVPHEDSVDVNHFSLILAPMKKKMNESVWSVESLTPYSPTNEWLMKNGLAEPDVIIEEFIEDTQKDEQIVQMNSRRRLSRRFSPSSLESLPVYVPSASWLSEQRHVNGFNRFPLTSQCNVDVSAGVPLDKASPPKKPALECETAPPTEDGVPECDLTMVVSEKDGLLSETLAQGNAVTPRSEEQVRDVENGSSEPEANRSPNQESLNVVERQVESPCPPAELEISPSQPVTRDPNCSVHSHLGIMEQEPGDCTREEAGQRLIDEELGVEMADQKMTTVSPLKAHMVDFGVQCSDLQECPCLCTSKAERKTCPSQIIDSGRGNKARVPEDICENGQKFPKRNGQGRNRQPDPRQHNKPFNQRYWQRDIQEEPYNGRLGKTKGGNGRNSRY